MRKRLLTLVTTLGLLLFSHGFAAPSVAAHGWHHGGHSTNGLTQISVHFVDTDQYVYTSVPYQTIIGPAVVQQALPRLRISFSGATFAFQSFAVSETGVWQFEVLGQFELQPVTHTVRIWTTGAAFAYAEFGAAMSEGTSEQVWPLCNTTAALLQGQHAAACRMTLQSPTEHAEPEEPESPELPVIVETPTPSSSVEMEPEPEQPAVAVPEAAAPPLLQPVLIEDALSPEVKPQPQPSSSAVLGESQSLDIPPPAPATEPFELTPAVAAVSVVTGIGVAGGAAFVVSKLGINKPKL
ncbi:hypothetical protein E6P97_03360 [Patescibacteria group bacterium]|nr:MAG: hypothetical protein E6P97_03360 [Patescibacteria group bacterium]